MGTAVFEELKGKLSSIDTTQIAWKQGQKIENKKKQPYSPESETVEKESNKFFLKLIIVIGLNLLWRVIFWK